MQSAAPRFNNIWCDDVGGCPPIFSYFGVAGVGYGVAGVGYGVAGVGYGVAGVGYGVAGVGYGVACPFKPS